MPVSGHFVRRSAEFVATFKDGPAMKVEFSPWLIFLVLTLGLIMGLALMSVEYTYGGVVATLAAVEDSNPDIYVRIDHQDPTKPLDPNEPELADSARLQPITSGLRSTTKHLRARAGFWSRFRGLSIYLAFIFVDVFLSLITTPIDSFLGHFISQFIISMLLSTWLMAWVHIVISEPSPKRFYQRIPSWRKWIRIAPAVALETLLTYVIFFMPMVVAQMAGWTEEDESIVPFDRSFGGKVQPEIVGGSGKIGLMDAWTTFDWNARVRFVKVVVKTAMIEIALIFVGASAIAGIMLGLGPRGVSMVPADGSM
ncbi:hypothetical protein N7509_006592 [Penicillium cosmopolitanum]|uniref:Uncharacterized protein n=1 Tax=Penicillium cosmopolitanum TaxID=1131564 RepID=A0A9X0B7L1_9EURO|nr:uncharacterized protein N7509_006592 [Penicillium cosmopolitanum]KAJ5391102.1 hypothetical protein N7509_006592 [Penicillium cosmopolitanum]